MIEVAKQTVCPKGPFPFGSARPCYSTACVLDVLPCKEICGRQCKGMCKTQHTVCDRGCLKSSFLFCQFSSDGAAEDMLPYSTYEVIEETNVKEGKKPYKR